MIKNALIAITFLKEQRPFFIVWTRSSSNIEKIEARENLNHDEYVEEEDYYNVDSDESDIDSN